MSKIKRLDGKIALVTGASRGIGAAVAKALADEGAQLILAARTVGGLEELDDAIRGDGGKAATIVPIDLQKLNTIDQLALQIAERFGKLDIFVGNAAITGGLRPIHQIPNDIWESVLAINLTANMRLIRALDPMLRKAEHGRAIFVTSGVTQHVFPYWGAYSVSKAGLEMMVKTYAKETEHTNVRVNLVDPGVVRTRMREEVMPGEDPSRLPRPEIVRDVFVELSLPSCKRHGEAVKVQ